MRKLHPAAFVAAFVALLAAFAFAAPASASVAPATVVPHNITEQACNGNTTTWVDVNSTFHGQMCFGFKGTTSPNVYARGYFSGNNCGYITWTSHGATTTTFFGPGDGDPNIFNDAHAYVSALNIWGWVGSGDGCNP